MSRPLIGTYKNITFDEIMEYGEVPKEFKDLVMGVYSENRGTVPLDILAYQMDIMSYDMFIKNYLKHNSKKLIHGDLYKNMDLNIQEYQFSENIKRTMIEYNIIPYQVTEYELIFLTPEVDVKDFKDQQFTIFRKTMADNLNALDKQERVLRCSNKVFMEGLLLLLGERGYTDQDLIYLEEQRMTKIFIDAILRNASDIYIDPKPDGINISISIFNDQEHYRRYYLQPAKRDALLSSVIRLSGNSPDKIEWIEGMKDYQISDLGGQDKRYEGRVNIIKTVNGLAPQIRIHDRERSVQRFEDLKINDIPKNIIRQIINNPSGIFLVAGAKGQGKSTTIYSCLDYIKRHRPNDRIEEMSNPSEIYSEDISQLSIDENAKVDWDLFLRASTRRNAQVIFSGEVNSQASARFVVDIAIQETLLLTTIHAESVSLVPSRVKGLTVQDPGAYLQFMELVKGIAHQVMLKGACPDCSRKIPIQELGTTKVDILKAYGYPNNTVLVQGFNKDCPTCNGLGFIITKPIVCMDVMEINDDIRDTLRGCLDNPRYEIERIAREKGTSGVHDAFQYLMRDEVTFDMIYNRFALWNMREQVLLDARRR